MSPRAHALSLLVCGVLGAACSPAPVKAPLDADGPLRSDGNRGHEDEPEKHAELPTTVRLSPEVVAAAHVRIELATSEALSLTVKLGGEVAVDPDHAAKVAARASGRVVEVRFREGQRVAAGDVLVVIESPELARARAALTSLRARAAAARANTQRLVRLVEKGLASGQEGTSAAAESAVLEAEETAARQTLAAFSPGAADAVGDAARIAVRSPIAGSILRRDAMRGETVAADHVLAEIADLDHVYFLGRVFEKDLARVAVGASTEVRLNAYPGEVFAGRVEALGAQLDPAARTVVARIALRNHEGRARVGLFGNALVSTGEREPAAHARVVVPLAAITQVADRDVVFVREADGDFELHRVTLGRSAGGRVEILSGLRAGEPVVTDGVFTLKSAVLKNSFGEEEGG